jgi:protein archease
MMSKSRKADKGWTVLDHTADVRIEVRGSDLKELFSNAARAFVELAAPGVPSGSDTELDVFLGADTVEELLVDWLRELLFLKETRGFVPVESRFIEISQNAIKARLMGRLGCRETGGTEVKAVTYHGLSVQKRDGGYVSKIVFDI